ncbi:uncharacterized protein NEMAJ01_1480 [Nematocida major]|uniref:uncharacterized protein n=1 Tax=Nematocida major TaxID=1912982 RepID=UPI0020088135|nr:uncharacterized protein NEMAJ01_1480 [Nematocida major]KAH9386584.1 hypothetical protein NEMAJ01_1480 [Nematocida major]
MESPPKQTLAHFLENRNFPAGKKAQKKRKTAVQEEPQKESLIIVDGQVVISGGTPAKTPVIEDRMSAFSYGRRPSAGRSRWSKEETIVFYKALSLCGTDFTLLEKVFTDKTRKQIKNKFSNEEKQQPERISQVLSDPKKFKREDLEALRREYTEVHQA